MCVGISNMYLAKNTRTYASANVNPMAIDSCLGRNYFRLDRSIIGKRYNYTQRNTTSYLVTINITIIFLNIYNVRQTLVVLSEILFFATYNCFSLDATYNIKVIDK